MSIDVNLSRLWTPHVTQAKFFEALGTVPDMGMVAYVGALGSGKTWALCRAAIGLAQAYPGMKILLGRFHSTDLRDTTQAEFFRLISQIEDSIRARWTASSALEQPPAYGQWHAVRATYEFPNGSIIMFRPLDEAENKYKSLEIAAFGIDEGSEIDTEAVMMLRARCRQNGYPHVGFVVSNPTGHEHWLYQWFVKKPQAGHVLFRTNTAENLENLPPNYVETLRSIYPADWVRRYLEGEWGELSEGRPAFPGFEVRSHVQPTKWIRNEPVLVGIDFGYKNPGVVWAQIDQTAQVRVIRTWFPLEILATKLCEGIRARNQEWFPNAIVRFEYFAGHDGNARRDTGTETAVEVFSSYGMRPFTRYYPVSRGLNIIRAKLDRRDNNTVGLVIDPINERLIEGMNGGYKLKAESEDPEKNGLHDQLVDALRYILVNKFSPSGEYAVSQKVRAFGRPVRRRSYA